MKEKVMITGGAGFIGYNTANKLASYGYAVRVFDNLARQVHLYPRASLSRLDPAIEFICGDVRDRSELQVALEGVDVVYHFAAETGVGQSMYEIERYSDVSIQGTAVLCGCIAKGKTSVKKIILSSSRAVYGEGQHKCEICGIVCPKARTIEQLKAGKWNPVCPQCGAEIIPIFCQETTPCRPVSIYGVTKKVQEELFNIFSITYKIPIIVLRYFNVFGPGQSVSNPYTGVLSIFTSLMLSNKNIEIYEDGQMLRDFIPIEEVVNFNVKALEMDVSDVVVVNIGSGVPRTIMQLAECLKAEIGSQSKVALPGRFRIGDIRHNYADMSKTNDLFGQIPKNSFKRGIKKLVEWARNEKNSLELGKSIVELSDLGLTGIARSPETQHMSRILWKR